MGSPTVPSTLRSGRVKLTTVADESGPRVAKVRARMKMDCQGDPPRLATFTVPIPLDEGRVSDTGRFSYTLSITPTTGFTIKGRFVTRTRARGTFGRSDAATGCYVGDVKWTATLGG